jgi:vanillate O-demethylase monooxygenase subunit
VATGFRQDDPATLDEFAREVAHIFTEDQAIIEAQQERLEEMGEADLMNISSDGVRMHMRRTVQRMLAEEERTASPAH